MNSVDPQRIHRNFVFRICSMGLFIAIVVGTSVWLTEKNKIGQDILWSAKVGFKQLNNRISKLLNNPDDLNSELIHQQIFNAMSERRLNRFGWFVSVGIYTLKGDRVAMVLDDTYKQIDFVREKAGRLNKNIKDFEALKFSVINIKGIPHLQIISPLKNDLNDLSAYGETFFAVSPETMGEIRMKAFRLTGVAILIVVLTTGLLYPVVITLLRRVSTLSAKLFDANLEMLNVLGSAVAKRDSDTDSHNYRVTIISVKLAETIGLPKQKIQQLIKGAFLHDVGKIGIKDGILHKPGRLNEDEFAVMKNHVPYGVDIVNRAEWIKDAIDIVGYHHEKYDGSGYGKGLKGDQIPEITRIFSIADVFDALTSQRPYKEPFTFEKTMGIIRAGKEGHFDPAYVDAFETIAFSMFEAYAKREDDQLKTELAPIIKQYFYHV